MKNTPEQIEESAHSAIAIALRMSFIAFLFIISFKILAPFILPIVWGVIISIAIYPLFDKLAFLLKGNKKIASAIIVMVGIAVFIVPFTVVIMNSVDGIESFVGKLDAGTFKLPPAPSPVADWPIIGEKLFNLWQSSSNNLEVLIDKLKPYLTDYLPTIFSSAAGVVGTIFQFIFSVIIAGLFLVNAEGGRKTANAIFKTIIGTDGEQFVKLSQGTIKGVVQGVLGTAVIQTIFLGIGMYAVGLPGAGVWTVLVLVVCIVQLPPTLIILPVIIYVFSVESTMVASIFGVWSIIWSASDNVIKPLLMGRGVEVPMLVILLGSIGGMMAFGIIGLFIGSVVLAITYKIMTALGSRTKS
ncbi:MAG: AI-2E family transporter [Salibacteraceae bacterium]